MSSAGASAETLISVPTPKTSIGAPAFTSDSTRVSLSPPLATDLQPSEASFVQHAAGGARQRVEIAGIEPHAGQSAIVAEPARQFNRAAHPFERVVGVDQ